MSGGKGARFGASIPKQYNLFVGRPVIDYVLDAVDSFLKTDRVVVVMDSAWYGYSEKIKTGSYDIAPNGATRIESMYNSHRYFFDACLTTFYGDWRKAPSPRERVDRHIEEYGIDGGLPSGGLSKGQTMGLVEEE